MTNFVIYGEYFGGYYPGIKSICGIVQKGIAYIPNHDLMVFDIRVEIGNK